MPWCARAAHGARRGEAGQGQVPRPGPRGGASLEQGWSDSAYEVTTNGLAMALRYCFNWRQCRQAQRMDVGGQFLGQRIIDSALPRDPALPGKSGRNNRDLKMSSAARPRSRMTGVVM
jgi:hypothetical protein